MRRLSQLAAGAGVAVVLALVALGTLPTEVTRWLGIGTVFVAASLLAYAVICLVAREEPPLDTALRLYDAEPAKAAGAGDGVAETRIVRRAVAMVEGMAERRKLLGRVEDLLVRADVPFRAGEALFFSLAGAGLLAVVALLLAPSPVLGLLLAGAVAALPVVVLKTLARRRRKKFVDQLPGTLELLSGSLRAGYSLMQGVEAVSHEVEDPMGRELRRVTVESRLGRPLEEALDDAAERLGSSDFTWAVMAIRIQREVGGNLSELLQTVAATMTDRKRLKREVDALTAEGKISAIILGLLPVGLGLALFLMNRPYIMLLFTEFLGQVMLAGATVLALGGFAWMKKIIKIGI
ncbi:MAG: type II secretion system F family protein [Actinobacteria bacterium]|nr:type II secretion system F family protein [Actinomycetota bacterium]